MYRYRGDTIQVHVQVQGERRFQNTAAVTAGGKDAYRYRYRYQYSYNSYSYSYSYRYRYAYAYVYDTCSSLYLYGGHSRPW